MPLCNDLLPRRFDHQLAGYDVAGSRAHANMLAKAGILTEQENDLIQQGLTDVLGEIERGEFEWRVERRCSHEHLAT